MIGLMRGLDVAEKIIQIVLMACQKMKPNESGESYMEEPENLLELCCFALGIVGLACDNLSAQS
jgi:hypothetical protein